MRKKIEELRNREEGFTLVELLAVIVILGIIVAIAIPAIGSVINKADTNATEAEKEMIVDAGRLYFTTEDIRVDKSEVGVDTLVDGGYLELRGGEEKKDLPDGGVVISVTTDGVATYEFDEDVSRTAPAVADPDNLKTNSN